MNCNGTWPNATDTFKLVTKTRTTFFPDLAKSQIGRNYLMCFKMNVSKNIDDVPLSLSFFGRSRSKEKTDSGESSKEKKKDKDDKEDEKEKDAGVCLLT